MWYKERMTTYSTNTKRTLAVAGTALLLWTGTVAPARAEFGLDVTVSRRINVGLGNGLFDDTMKGASSLAVPALVPVGLAIGGGDHGRRAALLVTATAVLAFGEAQLLKLMIKRARPHEAIPDLRIKWKLDTGSSFPSGHTAAAFGIATILSEQYPELWVQCLSYSMAGIVGFSRIYRGEHYLTDVMAGAALGYGTARGVLWLRDALGLHDQFGPAPVPQVSWTSDGTPTFGVSWALGR